MVNWAWRQGWSVRARHCPRLVTADDPHGDRGGRSARAAGRHRPTSHRCVPGVHRPRRRTSRCRSHAGSVARSPGGPRPRPHGCARARRPDARRRPGHRRPQVRPFRPTARADCPGTPTARSAISSCPSRRWCGTRTATPMSCGRTQGTTPTVRRSSRISAALWSPRCRCAWAPTPICAASAGPTSRPPNSSRRRATPRAGAPSRASWTSRDVRRRSGSRSPSTPG